MNWMLPQRVNVFKTVKAIVNVDGLPMFRSSPLSLWPILMSFGCSREPFPIALHYGFGKPSLMPFLQDFITEVKELRQEGYIFCGRIIKLGDLIFVCDARVRSHLQGVLGHTALKG